MSGSDCDALVIFGVTGDLSYKKIFPALQALVARGNLPIPVIGVARGGWTLARLRARVGDSLTETGDVDTSAVDRLSAQLHYVGGAQRPCPAAVLSRRRTRHVRNRGERPG